MKKYYYTGLLILFLLNCAFAQNNTTNSSKRTSTNIQREVPIYISGTVTDSLNEPFEGVNVVIVYNPIGTIVDENGKYKLDVTKFYQEKEKIILSFTYIGFKPVTREIDFACPNKEDLTVNVSLDEQADPINCDG